MTFIYGDPSGALVKIEQIFLIIQKLDLHQQYKAINRPALEETKIVIENGAKILKHINS